MRRPDSFTTRIGCAGATAIVAVIALATLEGIALAKGVNGATLALCISAITGIAGYNAKAYITRRRDKQP